MIRTYTELSKIHDYLGRFEYLKIGGKVGDATFGYDRYLNQLFYRSKRWRAARDFVIVRDNGCDLGIEGYELHDRILVHHMNPITMDDIEQEREHIFDPEYLICTHPARSHNAIHFGDVSLLPKAPITRRRNDTCPWR